MTWERRRDIFTHRARQEHNKTLNKTRQNQHPGRCSPQNPPPPRSFKDSDRLYFLLEPVLGGELFSFLRNQTLFTEETSRFYAANVLLAFEYMHSFDIVYRDLKPENLLIDEKGAALVCGFRFAALVCGFGVRVGVRLWCAAWCAVCLTPAAHSCSCVLCPPRLYQDH